MKELLKSFLDYLRLNRNLSPHTLRAYDGDISQFFDYLCVHTGRPRRDLVPGDCTVASIRGFLAELYREDRSRKTASRKLASVRTFCRYLRREGLMEGDPGALVATPRVEQRLPEHLEIDEMTRLLETPDLSSPLGRRDRAMLELFYASGLRLSELIGLDLEDVNLSSRMVRVLGKGGKERMVPFNTSAADALRAYLKDRPLLERAAASLRQGPPQRPPVPRASRRTAGSGALFVNYRGGRLTGRQRPPAGPPIRRGVQRPLRHQPSRAASLLRHAPARTRRGPAHDPGTARPRAPVDDAALHARQRGSAHRRLSPGASARRPAQEPDSRTADGAGSRCRERPAVSPVTRMMAVSRGRSVLPLSRDRHAVAHDRHDERRQRRHERARPAQAPTPGHQDPAIGSGRIVEVRHPRRRRGRADSARPARRRPGRARRRAPA